MVDMLPAVSTLNDNFIAFFMAASVRGTNVLTTSVEELSLPDVTSNNYQTIFTYSIGFEDVGIISVFSLFFDLRWSVNGNGATRWQISGDGGITFTTITEILFNVGVLTAQRRQGSGLWITSFNTGNDKFQVRLQAKANAGTVNTTIRDSTFGNIQYRQAL